MLGCFLNENIKESQLSVNKSTCKTLKDGTKNWHHKKKLHREDGPAIEQHDGKQEWYFQGKQIEASSLEEFQQLTGQTPVNKSTCKTLKNGTKKWYFKKKLHREDGPAVEYADGTKFWYLNGQLHRTDGPAVEFNGTKKWYLQGQLHREDGPAIECVNGTKEWYLKGQLHRTDGPAVEWANGEKWWYLNGERHRTDGPAMECASGSKCWYLNGQLHRADGPAIERKDGSLEWWYQGKPIAASSLAEFQQLTGQTSQPQPQPQPQPQLEVDAKGTKRWKLDGKLHRTDGPAIEYTDGEKWWYLNEQLHRTDGPALEWTDGAKEWWVHGQRHRTDGPAVEWSDGDQEWWYQGKEIQASSLAEFQQLIGQTSLFIKTEKKTSPKEFSLLADTKQGIYRAAAKRIPKTARTALVSFLKSKKIKTRWISTIQEMMETEYGLAILQMAMAWAFRSLPQLKEEPRALALAEEWAVDSIATVGDQVLEEAWLILTPMLRQVTLSETSCLPSSSIMISQETPDSFLESDSSEKITLSYQILS